VIEMQQLPGSQYRIQFGVKGWAAIAVGLIAFIAVAAALAIGFVLVALPMIVLAPAIYWFMPKRKVFFVENPDAKKPTSGPNGSPPGTIIDGTCREAESVETGGKTKAAGD
jgi:hypothetical protein